jgi:hypothetical protein
MGLDCLAEDFDPKARDLTAGLQLQRISEVRARVTLPP